MNLAQQETDTVYIPAEVKRAIKEFEPNCIQVHNVHGVGLRFVFKFDKRLGASFVMLDHSRLPEKPFEILVLRFTRNTDDYLAFPENGITDRSVGGLARDLSLKEAIDLLGEIKGMVS